MFHELKIFHGKIEPEKLQEAECPFDTYYLTTQQLLPQVKVSKYNRNGLDFYRADNLDSPVIEIMLPYTKYTTKLFYRGRIYSHEEIAATKEWRMLSEIGDDIPKKLKSQLKLVSKGGFHYSKALLDFLKENPDYKSF